MTRRRDIYSAAIRNESRVMKDRAAKEARARKKAKLFGVLYGSKIADDQVNAVVAQVGGDHYSKTSGLCPHCGGEIQHWDLVARHPYLEAQISKYIVRWQEKGREEDLNKARSYFDKLVGVVRLQKKAEERNKEQLISEDKKIPQRRTGR